MILLSEFRLASLRRRECPSSGEAGSPGITLLADVEEFLRDIAADGGPFDGMRAMGGRFSGEGACTVALRRVPVLAEGESGGSARTGTDDCL